MKNNNTTDSDGRGKVKGKKHIHSRWMVYMKVKRSLVSTLDQILVQLFSVK